MLNKIINSVLEKKSLEICHQSLLQLQSLSFQKHIKQSNLTLVKQFHKRALCIIILSKDRPAQLDLLLKSISINFITDIVNTEINIVYTASCKLHLSAYKVCFSRYSEFNLKSWEQISKPIVEIVTQILSSTSCLYTMILVDDCFFYRNFDLHSVLLDIPLNAVYATRLGFNICYSYTTNMKQQLPLLKPFKYFWQWSWSISNGGEWSYPGSFDGNIIPSQYVYLFFDLLRENSQLLHLLPNRLEYLFNYFVLACQPIGLCSTYTCVVNVPYTKVQKENRNHSMGYNLESLSKAYLNGVRIQLPSLSPLEVPSPHLELIFDIK